MSVSDRIGVFQSGKLMQVGKPEAIYRDPATLFVADFIGKINFFPATDVAGRAPGAPVCLTLDGAYQTCPTRVHRLDPSERESFGVPGSALVVVRPEHLTLDAGPDASGVPGRVRRVLFLGSIIRYFVTCEGALKEVMVESARPVDGIDEGTGVRLSFADEDAIAFVSEGAG